jgi:hypothetical protein
MTRLYCSYAGASQTSWAMFIRKDQILLLIHLQTDYRFRYVDLHFGAHPKA